MATIYIGIGSNIEPVKHVKQALTFLAQEFGDLQKSPVYQNPAVGFEGSDFLNMVVAAETDLPFIELPQILQKIEAKVGLAPEQKRKYRSRIIDLDLLLAGDAVYKDEDLIIPRPGITQFAFILRPLLDITPGLIDPKTKIPYKESMLLLENEYDMQQLQKIIFSDEIGR